MCTGGQSRERLAETLIDTACARDVFSAGLPSIAGDLRKLWKQKVELGLLPRETEELSGRAFSRVNGTLFIVNPPTDASQQIAELRAIMEDNPALRMPIVCWRNRKDFTVVETPGTICN